MDDCDLYLFNLLFYRQPKHLFSIFTSPTAPCDFFDSFMYRNTNALHFLDKGYFVLKIFVSTKPKRGSCVYDAHKLKS